MFPGQSHLLILDGGLDCDRFAKRPGKDALNKFADKYEVQGHANADCVDKGNVQIRNIALADPVEGPGKEQPEAE